MTKYDRRYIDPQAYEDLEAQSEQANEWRGNAKRDALREILRSSEIGRQRIFTAADNQLLTQPFRPVEVVRLAAPPELSQQFTVAWSLRAQQFNLGPFELSLQGRSYVQIDWGAGGYQHRALLDCGRGGQVTVLGSYVSLAFIPIDLADVPPGGFVGTVQNAFGASIAPGGGRETAAYFTDYLDAVNAGTGRTRGTPQHATDCNPQWKNALGTFNALDGATLQFLNRNGAVSSWWIVGPNTAATTSAMRNDWVPIPGDSSLINFTNPSANNYDQVNLVYRIAL